MIISILGCGWYGKALAKSLIKEGVTVKGSATSEEKLAPLADIGIIPYLIKLDAQTEELSPDFFTCDVLIISIPPKARQGEGGEYLLKLKKLIDAVRKYNVSKVIYISSTGVYAETNSNLTENDTPVPVSESGKVLLAAENLFAACSDFKTTVIRFGGLVGPGRHPGRFFAGKTDVPNGEAPVNLIHLDDCIAITKTVIKKDTFGITLNAVCPHHPPKSDFYTKAALAGGFEAPKFLDEQNDWKIIDSIHITPVLDYQFSIQSWDDSKF